MLGEEKFKLIGRPSDLFNHDIDSVAIFHVQGRRRIIIGYPVSIIQKPDAAHILSNFVCIGTLELAELCVPLDLEKDFVPRGTHNLDIDWGVRILSFDVAFASLSVSQLLVRHCKSRPSQSKFVRGSLL